MGNDRERTWDEVFADWREKFPFLKPVGTMRLMYRTDIILIGLFLRKSMFGGSYVISFEVKPLWKDLFNNFHVCFEYPVLLYDINRYTYYWIYFDPDNDDHHRLFKLAAKSTEEQFGTILSGIAESAFLLKKIDIAFIEDKFKGYREFMYHEFKLALALYFNDREMWNKAYQGVEESLRKKEGAVQAWNKPGGRWRRLLNRWQKRRKKNIWNYRGDIEDLREYRRWKREIDETLTDRDKFMAVCEENAKQRKVRSLNKGVLVETPYEYVPYRRPERRKRRRR